MNARQEEIVALITKNKRMSVNHLASQLGVSQVTIRKDLNTLEETGLLKHKQGFAEVSDIEDLNVRLLQHHPEKEKIAKEAAKMVHDGTTIMIESGSACALLAEELGRSGKHVTIITISYFIANFVKKYSNLTVYLAGGRYQPAAEVVVGNWVAAFLKNYHVVYLFAGTDGMDDHAFYSNNIDRAETARIMAKQADKLVVLTDSSKFKHTSTAKQFSLAQVNEVITDQAIAEKAQKTLIEARVKVNLV